MLLLLSIEVFDYIQLNIRHLKQYGVNKYLK